MSDLIKYITIPLIVGIVMAYVGYRFGIKRYLFERKILKKDAEIKRFEEMLFHIKKMHIAANVPQENGSKELLREAFQWFDENCLPYRNNEPYKKFDIIMKRVDMYITNPNLFSKLKVGKYSSLDIFEEITALRSELEELLRKMKCK